MSKHRREARRREYPDCSDTPRDDLEPRYSVLPHGKKKSQRLIASCHAAVLAVFIWQRGRRHQLQAGGSTRARATMKERNLLAPYSVFNSAYCLRQDLRGQAYYSWSRMHDRAVEAGAAFQGSMLILIERLLPHELFRSFLAREVAVEDVPAVPGAYGYGWVCLSCQPTSRHQMHRTRLGSPSCVLVRLDTGALREAATSTLLCALRPMGKLTQSELPLVFFSQWG